MQRINQTTPFFSLVLALVLFGSIAVAETDNELRGMEISSDGATITVGGQQVNLYGVHFPPESGLCGEPESGCRAKALRQLDQWVDDRHDVHCRVVAVATSGTHFAECSSGEQPIGQWLVGNGLALADRQVTRRYVRDEMAARRAGVGIWEHIATQFSMVR